MKYFYILIALFLISSNYSFSIPLRSVEEVDITALEIDNESRQIIETLLGLRAAYRDALKSVNSYNISYGNLMYMSENGLDELENKFQVPRFIHANQPVSTLVNMKRYGSRYLEYKESYNNFDGYLAADGTEKMAATQDDSLWTLKDEKYEVFYRNAKINGENITFLDGVENEKGLFNKEQPYDNEGKKLWNVVNEVDFEEMINGVIKGSAEIIELKKTTYEGTESLSIYLKYPEYDGAYKVIYSLEYPDYGQPLYFYKRSGCSNCDINNRTSIPEIEIHNISYTQVEFLSNEYLPVPSAFEHIRTDMGETMEIRHYFLIDASFDTIESVDTLQIPVKESHKISTAKGLHELTEIPSPYTSFVTALGDRNIGFADNAFQNLKERSIAMNPQTESIVKQVKHRNSFNMIHITAGFGGVLMLAGGILSFRKRK